MCINMGTKPKMVVLRLSSRRVSLECLGPEKGREKPMAVNLALC